MSFLKTLSLIQSSRIGKFTPSGVIGLSSKEKQKVVEIETEGKEFGKKVLFLAEHHIDGLIAGIDYIYELQDCKYSFLDDTEQVWAIYEPIKFGVEDEGLIYIEEINGIVHRVSS